MIFKRNRCTKCGEALGFSESDPCDSCCLVEMDRNEGVVVDCDIIESNFQDELFSAIEKAGAIPINLPNME